MRQLLALALVCGIVCPALGTEESVGPIPDELRSEREIDSFYQKYLNVKGFAILSSEKVTDNALYEAAWILEQMLEGRDDILQTLSDKRVHLAIMAYNEYTSDIPEHRRLRPRVFWDRRARGLGGRPVSCGEENLLCYPDDPYAKENLLIHEFSHAVEGIALRAIDPTFEERLTHAYRTAIDKQLWKGTYAGSNAEEYWAEAVQSWFDDNRENDALHNHVNTRKELKAYDPALAQLCEEVFGDKPWRYRKPGLRTPADRSHLLNYAPDRSPRFRWREEPIPREPKVLIQTELGDIELELDATKAPNTVRNFLYYVHQGFYNDGIFFRTVTLDNQENKEVKIEVIQAQADPTRTGDLRPAIAIERTRDSGLKHVDGTISMARMGPDTAQDHFFICIGNQPELDFGGRRNPDGQGFAAFGHVTKGMDVIHKIQEAPAKGQNLTPAIRIQRAIRRN